MEIDKKIKDKLSQFKEIDKSTISSKKYTTKKSKEKLNKNSNFFKKNSTEEISEIEKGKVSENQINKLFNKNPQSLYSTLDNMNILRNYIKGGNLKDREAKEECNRKSKEKQIINKNKSLTEKKIIQEKNSLRSKEKHISQENREIRSNFQKKNLNSDFDKEFSDKNNIRKNKYIDINDFIEVKNNQLKPEENQNFNRPINFFDAKITPINKQTSKNGFFSNEDADNSDIEIKRSIIVNKEIDNFNKETKYQIQINKKNSINNNKNKNNLSSEPLFYVSPIRRKNENSTSNSNSLILDGDGMTNIIMNKQKNLNIVNLDNLYQGSFNKDFCELYSNNNTAKIISEKTNFQNYIKSTSENFKANNSPIKNINSFGTLEAINQNSNMPIQGLNRFNKKQDEQKKIIHNRGENFISVKTSKLPGDIRKMINPDYNSNDPMRNVKSKKTSKIVNIEIEEVIKENSSNNIIVHTLEKEQKENINLIQSEKKEIRRSDKLNHDYILLQEKMDKKRNEEREKIFRSASPQITKKAQSIVREGHLFHCRLYPYHKVFQSQMLNRNKTIENIAKSYYNKSNDIKTNKIMYYNNRNSKSSYVVENLKRLEGIEDIKTYKIYRTNKHLDDSANLESNENAFTLDLDINHKSTNLNKSLFERNEFGIESQKNKSKSFKPILNENSMKIAKSLEPAKLRLIKKRKKKILNDSSNLLKKSGSKRYFNNNNNSLDNLNQNKNIISYDDYFTEKNNMSRSTNFFNSKQYNKSPTKRNRSNGMKNLDLYKRGIEKMKKKEAIYTKNKLDEEESYKKYPFKPNINNLPNSTLSATRKFKEENFEFPNENISNVHNINYGLYLSDNEQNKPSQSSGSLSNKINKNKRQEDKQNNSNKKSLISFYDKNMYWKQNIEKKSNKMKEEKENDYKNIHTFKPDTSKTPLSTDEKFIEKNIDHIQEYVDKRRKIIQKNLNEISYKNSRNNYKEDFKMKTTIPREFNLSYKSNQKIRNTSASMNKDISELVDQKEKTSKSQNRKNDNRNNLINMRNDLKIKEFFEFIEPEEEINEQAYTSNSFFTRNKNLFNINNNLKPVKFEKSLNDISVNSKGMIKNLNGRNDYILQKNIYGYSDEENANNKINGYNHKNNLDKFNEEQLNTLFGKNSYIDNSINIYNYPQNSEIVYGNQIRYIGNSNMNPQENLQNDNKENLGDSADEGVNEKIENFYDSVNLMHKKLNKD